MAKVSGKIGVRRIISGGQTGVDRGALDAAIELGIEHGGCCPRGRLSEDGTIPDKYNLTEALSAKYAFRTEQNVIDSDATLILHMGDVSGGSELTRRMAEKHEKPFFAANMSNATEVNAVRTWLAAHEISVLNIAGPRESSCDGISSKAKDFVRALFGLD